MKRFPQNDGLIVINKPLHMTSFDVVARVRRLTGERRIGHTGTLDPLASGVLILCLGEATKLVPYLMDEDKEYRATARLGRVTDTDDADPRAQVLATAPTSQLAAVAEEQVRAALAGFVGWLQQRPPRFSALKLDGQRLYDKARKARQAPPAGGEPQPAIEDVLAQKARPVRIDELVLEEFRPATSEGALPEVVFRVRCGKGTYVRSLARDLGEVLGVGAHLSALRRLRVGRFDLRAAVPPEQAGQAPVHGLLSAVAHLPQLELTAEEAQRLRWGQPTVLHELAPRLWARVDSHLAAATDPPSLATEVAVAALDPRGQLLAILTPLAGTSAVAGCEPQARAGFQIARGFVDKLPAAEPGASAPPRDAVEGEPCITDCA